MNYDKIKEYYENVYWKENYGSGAGLPDLRRNLSFLSELPEKVDVQKKSLDIGCGDGLASLLLSQRGYQVFGVDISQNALALAKRLVPQGNFFLAEKSGKLIFQDEEFDLITCLGVLEHIEDPQILLQECYRTLKKDGTAIFVVPNSWHPYFWFGGTGQILEQPRSLAGWKKLFESNQFDIKGIAKDPGPGFQKGLAVIKNIKVFLHKCFSFFPLCLTYQFKFSLKKHSS